MISKVLPLVLFAGAGCASQPADQPHSSIPLEIAIAEGEEAIGTPIVDTAYLVMSFHDIKACVDSTESRCMRTRPTKGMRAKLEAYNRVEVRFQGHIELAPSMPIQVCGDGCLRPLIVIDEAEDALSILTRTRMGLEHRQNPVIDTFRPPDQSGALELRALGVGFFTGTLPLLDVWTENPTKAGFDRLEWLTKIIRTRSDDLGTLDVEVDVDVAIIDPSIAGEGRAVVCICRREECPIDSIQQNVMDQSVRDSSYCLPAVRGAAGWRLDTAFLEAFQ